MGLVREGGEVSSVWYVIFALSLVGVGEGEMSTRIMQDPRAARALGYTAGTWTARTVREVGADDLQFLGLGTGRGEAGDASVGWICAMFGVGVVVLLVVDL